MVQPPRVRFVQRLPSSLLIGAAVLGVLALVALGVASASDDADAPPAISSPTSVAPAPLPEPPEGVTAERYAPDEMGVTLQLPSTWVERDGEEGYDVVYESPDGDAFVFVDRRDITEGRGRVDALERLGAVIEDERTTDLDGHDAQVLTYEAPFPGRGIADATELDIDLGDGTFAIVVVARIGGPDDTTGWLAETVRVARR